ncbi:MAG: SGNH/GDSL hydrolase family protein [Myxococcaceae bacterium]|nr:SGNH/GDSL hydrolase family protein [Myxococcaceae bacterium]
MTTRFERYVAIGDSTTEGLDDPDGQGGYIGWADRLARRIAHVQGGLLYANLAVRGLTSTQIREQQLEAALALKPDLVTVVVGMNDLIRPRFDHRLVAGELETMMRAFRGAGSTVLSFTLPDLSKSMAIGRLVRERALALNEGFRAAAARTGSVLFDLAVHPLTADRRLWAADRLHASALGHERIGHALARTLGVPGDDSYNDPLPAAAATTRAEVLRAEAQWARTYLVPWLVRRATGRSSSTGVTAKRPTLTPVAL